MTLNFTLKKIMKSICFIIGITISNWFIGQIPNSSTSASNIQKTELVDDFISKMAPSNRTVSNIYVQNDSKYDFNGKYKSIIGRIEDKKGHIKLLKELRSELEEYDSRKNGGTYKLEYIKEQYEKACRNQVVICDEKLLKKLWKKELFLNKEFDFSTIDFNSATPLIYSEISSNNTVKRYYLLLKEYKKDRNGNIISSSLFSNSISHFLFKHEISSEYLGKIEKLIRDEKPLEDLERKAMVGKVTGLNDRFFEIERLIIEASQRNEMLTNSFRLTEKGGLYIGSMQNNEYFGFGMMFNALGDTIFVGKWDKNYPDLKNGKLFQYNCSNIEIYINDKSNMFITYPPTGDVFCGQSIDNNRNGKGTYIWSNDNFYSGDWISSERTGKGIFIWQNGDRFDGSFYKGDRAGMGKYIFNDGSIWEGNWQGTNFSGIGKQTSKNGTITEGLFENGKLIKSKETIDQERLAQQKEQEERLAQINKQKEEEKKLKEEQDTKNAELFLSLLRTASENKTESQPNNSTNNSTNNQNNKSSNNSGTSRSHEWVDVKCGDCHKNFKFKIWKGGQYSSGNYWGGWEDELNSKPGYVKCGSCTGYGLNWDYDGKNPTKSACKNWNCSGGWMKCSKCYGSGTVRELH
jgi:hypothetical protein